MKLDVSQLRYLGKEDFRVLQAVELGQKNHELVPKELVESIAGLKYGGTERCLKILLKAKLLHHDSTKYDGYRLTYLGYDYLAIKALVNRGLILSVGRQLGVGKEADVFEVVNENGEVMALKLHRLGRTSFRAVKSKRDYLEHRSSYSWLYLSRLAATKEFSFMKALGEHGFPVPAAIDSNRHAVLMSLVDAFPLVQVRELQSPGFVFQQCMDLMSRLATKGLVHCDFNEFNLLIDEEEKLTLIDFPQMVSISHPNAEDLFYRDVDCVLRFFHKKLGYVPERDPDLAFERPNFQNLSAGSEGDLSSELRASGFQNAQNQEGGEALAPADTHEAAQPLTEDVGSISSGDEECRAENSAIDGSASSGGEKISGSSEETENVTGSRQDISDGVDDQKSLEVGTGAERELPSQGTVQQKVAIERRQMAQSRRIKSATRNAQRSSGKRTGKKGSALDM